MSYAQNDFTNGTFDGISHTADGITKYGFMQLMLREDSDKIRNILYSLLFKLIWTIM